MTRPSTGTPQWTVRDDINVVGYLARKPEGAERL